MVFSKLRMRVLVVVSSLVVACSGGESSSVSSGDGGAAAPATSSGSGATTLDGCDRQSQAVTENVCGSVYEELWTCPASHEKPMGCKLSTQTGSFCCPLTPPAACNDFCKKAQGCANETCAASCAVDLVFMDQIDLGRCRSAAETYLRCIANAAVVECRAGAPHAAACDAAGEASIRCQTEGDFVRTPKDDATCGGKALPPYAFRVTRYGYSPHCESFDGDDTLSPGELMCCAYP